MKIYLIREDEIESLENEMQIQPGLGRVQTEQEQRIYNEIYRTMNYRFQKWLAKVKSS